jgi:hypothetical protein
MNRIGTTHKFCYATKSNHCYAFHFTDCTFPLLCKQVGKFAVSSRLDFSWLDAARVVAKARELMRTAKHG